MSGPAQVKRVRALHQRKFREAEGLFLVQGRKQVRELLASAMEVVELHATAEAAREMDLRNARLWPSHELARMGTLENGNEVVAVVRMPAYAQLTSLQPLELVLAMDGIADPGNLGTVMRIADWFGIGHVLCGQGSVDAFNPKCVQASMGAFLRVQVHYVDLPAELERLRTSGAALYLASMEGRSVFEAKLQRPAILVLGSESHGLSSPVRALQGELISIPRLGAAESLNVAMAASALCMEFARLA